MGWLIIFRSLLELSSTCLIKKITIIKKRMGSVGKYNPTPPESSSKFKESGVQNATNKNNLSSENKAAKTVINANGSKFRK